MTSATSPSLRVSPPLAWTYQRQAAHYPAPARKYFYLVIVVLSGMMVYFEDYVAGAETPILLPRLHMSLAYYSYLLVVFGVIGGGASYFGSFADRFGRANIVVYVGIALGLITAFAVPSSTSEWAFAFWYCVLGFGDGIIFIAVPALVRDFSPQVGRATAMGAVTLTAVAGSLITSVAATQVLHYFRGWGALFVVAGLCGVVISLINFFSLKELTPELRNQKVVVLKEERLAELRMDQVDVAQASRNRWRSLFRISIVGSAIAIGLFLVVYVTAVGYFTLYFTEILKFKVTTANNLNTVYWGVNCGTLLAFGILSDLARVRKPFMVGGALGAIGATLALMNEPHPSFALLAVILSCLAGCLGAAFAPWFASFTETIESINPALIATGLAFYGFAVRGIQVIQGLVIPHVIGSPLGTVGGWQAWFYVCIGGLVVFLPFTLTMTGRWSPRRAAEERRRHAAEVEAALAARAATSADVSGSR